MVDQFESVEQSIIEVKSHINGMETVIHKLGNKITNTKKSAQTEQQPT